MPLPIICFTPVPLRSRRDGWSGELQLRFVRLLADGTTPAEAARLVGKNRQTAYALRKRPGAQSFASAWDSAVAFARSRRPKAPPPRPSRTPEERALAARRAEEVALRGVEAVRRAEAESPAAARRALDRMLDALYGPKSDSVVPEGGEK